MPFSFALISASNLTDPNGVMADTGSSEYNAGSSAGLGSTLSAGSAGDQALTIDQSILEDDYNNGSGTPGNTLSDPITIDGTTYAAGALVETDYSAVMQSASGLYYVVSHVTIDGDFVGAVMSRPFNPATDAVESDEIYPAGETLTLVQPDAISNSANWEAFVQDSSYNQGAGYSNDVDVSPSWSGYVDPADAIADGVVEGTSGNDVIDTAYDGDPHGEQVDNSDGSNGTDGDEDRIEAGGGNDTVYAGKGSDDVDGGTGNDTIYGDSESAGAGTELLTNGSFEDGTHSSNGVNGLTGWSNYNGSPDSADDGTNAEYWNPNLSANDGTGYVTMWSYSNQPQEGMQQTLNTPLQAGQSYTLDFTAQTLDYVNNQWFTPTNIPVTFEILDQSTGQVIGSMVVQGDTYTDYSLEFTPTTNVSTIVIRPNAAGQGTYPSLALDSLSLTETSDPEDGDDRLEGGEGDDVIYGEGGDDVIYGDTSGTSDAEAVLIAEDKFDNGTSGWSEGTTQTLSDGTEFLGGFGSNGSTTATEKTFELDTSKDAAVAEFDLYMMDSWDGENFFIEINGEQVSAFSTNFLGTRTPQAETTFTHSDGTVYQVEYVLQSEGNLDGQSDYEDVKYSVRLTAENPPATLEIGFGSTLNQGASDESFGIDNFTLASTDSVNTDISDPASFEGSAGTSGDDELYGGAGDDTIYGQGGDDDLSGGEGDDTLFGGSGTNTMDGGTGDDTFYAESGGTVIGGEDAGNTDTDTLNLTNVQSIQYQNSSGGNVTGPTEQGVVTFKDGSTLNFSEIEAITTDLDQDGLVEGTDGDDLIDSAYTGDPDGDRIDAGDERIAGEGVDDDIVFADAGNDTVRSGDGNDEVYGGSGDDRLEGGDGDDILHGDTDGSVWKYEYYDLDPTGNPVTLGQAGFTQNGGRDHEDVPTEVGYGDSIRPISYDTADDYALKFTSELTVTTGGTYNFSTTSDDGSKLFINGVEVVDNDGHHGMVRADGSINLPAGNHTIEIIFYENNGGNDMTATISGPDTGNSEVNLETYGALDQPDGDDVLAGGAGDDTMYGEGGDDTFELEDGFGDDTILGGETEETNGDSIDGSALTENVTVTFSGDEAGTVTNTTDTATFSEIEQVTTGAGDDQIDASATSGGVTVSSGAGDDTFTGGSGADTFDGGDDRDTFNVDGAGDGWGDDIDGGSGGDDFDTLDLTGSTSVGGTKKVFIDGADSDGNGSDGRVEYYDSSGNLEGTLTFTNIESIVPCFTPGTLIKTKRGEVSVEQLRLGDRVMTRDNGFQPVRWIGTKCLRDNDLAAQPNLRPIRISAGALGDGLPERDMLVSPQHRMLVTGPQVSLWFGEEEALVAAKHLTCLDGVEQVTPSEVTYVHIMFDNHEIVVSDGTWSESFQPGDMSLAGLDGNAREELLTLFPELAALNNGVAYPAARMTLKAREVPVVFYS